MTTLGQQTVRFTGSPVLPGNTAAPAITGSADACRDGHAEVFVKVDSGASTQFWTIFKLLGRRIRQVNQSGTAGASGGRRIGHPPERLPMRRRSVCDRQRGD